MNQIKSVYRSWFVLASFILLFSTTAMTQDKVITPEMVVSLERVSQVSLDPTGQWIAYVLSVPRSVKDAPGGAYSEIWIVSTKSGESKQYTSKPVSAWSVGWSPNGKSINFLSCRKEHDTNTQVYQMRMDGGEATALTHHETSVSRYQWSPDGKSIAFLATDPATDAEKKAKKTGQDWKVADENFKHRHVWVMNVAKGKSQKLYEKDLSTWSYAWASDSKTIAIQATDTPLIDDSYMYKKIYTVSVDGGRLVILCKTEGKLGNMAYSPDGTRLAFVAAVSLNDPIAQSVFVVSTNGGSAKNLTENYKATINWVGWLNNNDLILSATLGTQTFLNRLNVSNGEMKKIVDAGPILQSLSVQSKKGLFAAVAHTSQHPQEVFAGSLKNGVLKRLTKHNSDLAAVKLGKQEAIEWKAKDGMSIEGILTYPIDYQQGQRYPLVLQIHGGPEGVSLNGWNTRSGYPVQVLAANGYMVLEPNYRGSAGKGVAFSKADHDDLGGSEFGDVLAGVDALIDRGLVDPDRIGTGGWSYGGYFSAWAATRFSERFKASVVAAGITNWISFNGTTDIPHEMSLVHWNSYWYDQRDLHWQRSPMYHIENAKTPTLVVHGMSDARVHPGQGIELYTALKHKKVPTKLVLYPRQPHGLRERAHQLDFIKRVVAWFDQYLKQMATN